MTSERQPRKTSGKTGPRAASPRTDEGASHMLAFRHGDEESFVEIVKLYRDSVLHFLRRRVRDHGRAEDLTQEVFLRVYRARASYEATAGFRSWLLTIANRLALNELRATRRRHRVFARWLPLGRGGGEVEGDPVQAFWSNVPARGDVTPLEAAEAKELEGVLEELLQELPPNQRTAVELGAGQRLSYAEIAEVMDLSVAAVRSLLVRARQTLRSRVEACWNRNHKTEERKP